MVSQTTTHWTATATTRVPATPTQPAPQAQNGPSPDTIRNSVLNGLPEGLARAVEAQLQTQLYRTIQSPAPVQFSNSSKAELSEADIRR
jgi:hypothetical protein